MRERSAKVHGSHAAPNSRLGVINICPDKLLAQVFVHTQCFKTRSQAARHVLPKCAIQLLSNGHERCTCIYIAQLWHEEHVCSKVMTRADMEHKDMCNTTFKMMMRMTGVLEVDILGTTSSQGLVKHLHQQQCDSYTHTHTPLHTFAGFTSKYFSCKTHTIWHVQMLVAITGQGRCSTTKAAD